MTQTAAEALDGPRPERPSTPAGALDALLEGNGRYAGGNPSSVDYNRLGEEIAHTQKPFAAIIACADSRLSPPAIFDLAPGHIFVSRVAGNSIDTGMLGSTEYAVAVLGVPLVMVLGHSECGAVKAALEVAAGSQSYPRSRYGAIGAIVEPVVASVNALPPAERTLPTAVAANAKAQAERLAATGPIIEPAVRSGKLGVVAAVYDIASRRVSVV